VIPPHKPHLFPLPVLLRPSCLDYAYTGCKGEGSRTHIQHKECWDVLWAQVRWVSNLSQQGRRGLELGSLLMPCNCMLETFCIDYKKKFRVNLYVDCVHNPHKWQNTISMHHIVPCPVLILPRHVKLNLNKAHENALSFYVVLIY
jgi:hypothetical protein